MTGSIALIFYVVWAILILAVVSLSFFVFKLNKKLRTFMTGKDGSSLEATLAWLTEKSANTDNSLEAHKEALEIIDSRIKRSVRGYSLVRYNAFETSGGEQSFATCLLDEHEDGYVLSVITNRNHSGIYAKKINRGISDTSLTEEENQALQDSIKSLKI